MERKRTGPDKQALMLRQLVDGTASYSELEAIGDQSHLTVANWIKALRASGMVFIAGWDRDARGYPTIPRFRWGVGEFDVMRPSIPANIRAKKLREKRKVVVNENE